MRWQDETQIHALKSLGFLLGLRVPSKAGPKNISKIGLGVIRRLTTQVPETNVIMVNVTSPHSTSTAFGTAVLLRGSGDLEQMYGVIPSLHVFYYWAEDCDPASAPRRKRKSLRWRGIIKSMDVHHSVNS